MKAKFLALAIVLGLASVPVYADPIDLDFSGTFTFDNDVLTFSFNLTVERTVTIFSSSWLQGDPPAGFDPMLGLWDSSGNFIDFQDDGGLAGSTLSNGVPFSHGIWDSHFQATLAAGDYIVTITQFDNFNVGATLANGFDHDGNPNFTFDLGFGGATQPMFNGVWDGNDPRSPDWEFHVLNVDSVTLEPSPIPEPSTLLLLGSGLLVGAAFRKRLK